MPKRKKIPPKTERIILTKSRRRCCLCFWLDGVDEVQKGQIAHIDGDSSNNDERNLAFLCFDHHDDLDGQTRLAKGLTEDEVKHWRGLLYQEIEHRYKTRQPPALFLEVDRINEAHSDDWRAVSFIVRNKATVVSRNTTVAIRLFDGVVACAPKDIPSFRLLRELTRDLFEKDGRVAMYSLALLGGGVLLGGHESRFAGLCISKEVFSPGQKLLLDFCKLTLTPDEP